MKKEAAAIYWSQVVFATMGVIFNSHDIWVLFIVSQISAVAIGAIWPQIILEEIPYRKIGDWTTVLCWVAAAIQFGWQEVVTQFLVLVLIGLALGIWAFYRLKESI